MCNEDQDDMARRTDAEHEDELARLLAATADELVQRYAWNEARLVRAIRLTLVNLAAYDSVESARLRAIQSELPAPESPAPEVPPR